MRNCIAYSGRNFSDNLMDNSTGISMGLSVAALIVGVLTVMRFVRNLPRPGVCITSAGGSKFGAAIGTSLGVVFDNIAYGVALGISLGVAVGAIIGLKKDQAVNDQVEEKGYTIKEINLKENHGYSIVIEDKFGNKKEVLIPSGIMETELFSVGDVVYLDEDGMIEQVYDKDER